MSLIGGFPIGAKMTAELYCDGRLTENQAQRLNMFCMNAGPAFTVTAVGVSMLSSRRACGVLPLPAITAIIGFGGFCVHCQVYQFIAKTGIKYRLFFAFRAINAAVAALISHILFTLFPVEVSTLSAPAFDAAPFSASLPAFLALAAMCVIMIFDVDTKKKLW